MNNLRALAATIGLAACVLGVMMVFPAERQAGHALVIGGDQNSREDDCAAND